MVGKMVKEEKPIFLKTLLVVLAVLMIESISIFYIYSSGNLSGFSIISFTEAYKGFNASTGFFLLAQWLLLSGVVLIAFFKNKGIWKGRKERKGINLEEIKKRSKTDLDALYIILQEKKQISVKSIAALFEIKKDLAIEWAQILESGELATLEYPGFGGPVLILAEKKPEETLGALQQKKEKSAAEKSAESADKSKDNVSIEKSTEKKSTEKTTKKDIMVKPVLTKISSKKVKVKKPSKKQKKTKKIKKK